MNAYWEEFLPDTEVQETAPLPADEITDIIYNSMPTTWKCKMIEQGFNYADSTIKEMTDFFDSRVEKLEPKEENQEIPQEKEKGRLLLRCRRVQRRKYWSLPSKQEVLNSTR